MSRVTIEEGEWGDKAFVIYLGGQRIVSVETKVEADDVARRLTSAVTPTIQPDHHPEYPLFVKRGTFDMDAGLIWIGDPCYVFDHEQPTPKEVATWDDFLKVYHERSGEDAAEEEGWGIDDEGSFVMMDEPAYVALNDAWLSNKGDKDAQNAIAAYSRQFCKDWRASHPLKAPASYVASFNHDLGHSGLGLALSSYRGDGIGVVSVEYGANGKPRRVLIDFDPPEDPIDESPPE